MIKHKIDLKDFKLSSTKKIEKSLSHINDKGDLIKDRDYSINTKSADVYYPDVERKKKMKHKTKAKRKKKGCGCK
jgi:hypothetical protein